MANIPITRNLELLTKIFDKEVFRQGFGVSERTLSRSNVEVMSMMEQGLDRTWIELQKTLLADRKPSIVVEVPCLAYSYDTIDHYEYATWWDHFKQKAKDAGNPFFEHAKINRRAIPKIIKTTASTTVSVQHLYDIDKDLDVKDINT